MPNQTITHTIQNIEDFFDQYGKVFNTALNEEIPDPEKTAALFTNCFIAANPSGVHCGQNDETFRVAMKKGYSFYKTIGITSMDIISKKITVLDEFHTMVKIHWRCNYQKKDGFTGSIEFENIYFTQTRGGQHKVFAYITGDEQAALQEAGLL